MYTLIKKIILIGYFILFNSFSAFAVDENEAKIFIERVGQEAINILKIPIENIKQREVLFRQMFDNNFDKKLIHRAIIGKKAAKGATKEELIRFGKAFDKHIVKVYASQLGVYSNQLFIIDDAKNINEEGLKNIIQSHPPKNMEHPLIGIMKEFGGCNGMAHTSNIAHNCDLIWNNFPHRTDQEVTMHKALYKMNQRIAKEKESQLVELKRYAI